MRTSQRSRVGRCLLFITTVIAVAGATMSTATAAVDPVGPRAAGADQTWIVTLVGHADAPREAPQLAGRQGGRCWRSTRTCSTVLRSRVPPRPRPRLRAIPGRARRGFTHAPRGRGRAERDSSYDAWAAHQARVHRRHQRRHAGARRGRRHRHQARPRRPRRQHRSGPRHQLHQPRAAAELTTRDTAPTSPARWRPRSTARASSGWRRTHSSVPVKVLDSTGFRRPTPR